eukprot:SAG25_NODE_15306_length_133_cov_30.558824_1_plen_23_part_01
MTQKIRKCICLVLKENVKEDIII